MLLSLGIGCLLTFAPLPLITILLMPVLQTFLMGECYLGVSLGMLLITVR